MRIILLFLLAACSPAINTPAHTFVDVSYDDKQLSTVIIDFDWPKARAALDECVELASANGVVPLSTSDAKIISCMKDHGYALKIVRDKK